MFWEESIKGTGSAGHGSGGSRAECDFGRGHTLSLIPQRTLFYLSLSPTKQGSWNFLCPTCQLFALGHSSCCPSSKLSYFPFHLPSPWDVCTQIAPWSAPSLRVGLCSNIPYHRGLPWPPCLPFWLSLWPLTSPDMNRDPMGIPYCRQRSVLFTIKPQSLAQCLAHGKPSNICWTYEGKWRHCTASQEDYWETWTISFRLGRRI